VKRTLIALATVMVLIGAASPVAGAASARAEPPYYGTIFLDPDIVVASDPSALVSVTDAGRGVREVYDRRVEAFIEIDAYLFDVVYDDGLTTAAVVNPEFGSVAAAREQADTYAWLVGQLPHVLRVDVDELWIHRGTEAFGGGNHSILIHTGMAEDYKAGGILEETLIHEATHTSLDAGYYRAGSGWLQAQADDDAFISTYARDFPLQEDVSETFLLYLAVRHRLDRIDAELAENVLSIVPHRLAFLDTEPLDLYPITPKSEATVAPVVDGWVRESKRSSSRAGTVKTGTAGLPVGDDRAGREIRALLSFDLDDLPQAAVVTGVQLEVTPTGRHGRAPKYLRIDLWRGGSGTPAVTAADFSARATRSVRVPYPSGGGPQLLTLPAYGDVFRPGVQVQVRVRAVPVRDRNRRADQVVLASGESASRGPQLTVSYTNG
jgi:hypothetical protein